MPIESHPWLDNPDDSMQLWRYMSFVKLYDLIQSSELHLTRLDHFANDPWEGKLPPSAYDPNSIVPVSHQIVEDGGTISLNNKNVVFMKQKDVFGDGWENYVKTSKQGEENMRRSLFVNCWHRNTFESEAAWNLYGKSDCIAIRTTAKRIRAAVRCDQKIYMAKVKYYDPQRDADASVNSFLASAQKRIAYEHEKEVRIIYWCTDSLQWWKNPPYLFRRIKVDLSTLLEEIWVSPYGSGDLLEKSIRHLLDLNKIDVPIVRSSILRPA